ncbi:unnamed protein product [Didymodactylos carnosus]|uniref:MULE transposase domain-containing protein n=1 Tax=Didymodactylos carnosus TaxID=1234261 RepID=A0A8S2GMN5_9BILA|nr:unnamed protein product [Didymodactylos carnosus]CAF3537488.1 unnamed protein product [Didymodactylos carnosus]
MAKVEISETGRGKSAAQFEGYSYRIERHQTESISWKCREYGCPGRLNTLKDYTKPDLRTPHLHGPDPEKLAVEKVVVDMRKRCEHQLPYAAFQASSQVVTDPQIAAAIPSFESLRSTLYRHKGNKNEPPTPTSLRNLCIPDKYGKLCTGENFLQIQSSGYVVLATEHGLRLLFNATEVHVDGNFKVAPTSQAGGTPLFTQLFSFFGLFHNKILPLAFVFFNGKSKKKYSKLLRCLKDKAFALMMLFTPDKIVLDFETGLVPAIQDEFPLSEIIGCNFHFNQALYRNLQNLGLQQEYVDDEAVRKYFRMISGIPFLPTHLVQSTYDEVVDSTPLRIRHKMQPFYHYFSNTWLNGQYAIEVWNVYGQDRRTNNDVESWHSKLSRLLQTQPTVWRWIETLQAQYVLVQHDIERLRAGTYKGRKNLKYQKLNRTVQRITDNFNLGLTQPLDFVLAIGRCFAAAKRA